MRVALPHQLDREEVRRRMRDHAHEIADYFPAGLATIDTAWPSEDRMDLTVHVVGKAVQGGVEIEDDQVFIEIDLPPALGFLRGVVERSVKNEGTRLLEKK
ncbi:MAG: polyhydroxyalkanoic acid system family protein [Pseudomonadota bacterium]